MVAFSTRSGAISSLYRTNRAYTGFGLWRRQLFLS